MLSMQENIRPPFSTAEAAAIARQQYGIAPVSARPLPSELDRNFHIQTAAGAQFLLKITHSSVTDSALDLQIQTMRHLRARLDIIPETVAAANGDMLISARAKSGEKYRARLLRYIEGLPLSEFRPHSPALLAAVGGRLGALSAAMQDFQHEEKRRDYRWNLLNLPAVAQYAADLPREKLLLLQHFLRLYTTKAQPALPRLRHSHIHNDANDSNILVRAAGAAPPEIAGLIDFGDMVYGATVAELAVALAYIMMGSEQPLEKAAPVMRAYHQAFPLREDEIRLLYPLIAARLCLSVCISWHQQRREPGNRHLSISESGAWDLLARLRDMPPRYAEYSFRAACGLPACPQGGAIVSWLRGQRFAPILGFPLTAANSKALDLGMTSRLLAQVSDLADPHAYAAPLRAELGAAEVGIGLYNEVRPIYLAAMFAHGGQARRTVHLGIDLFAAAGSAVYAPLAGQVHSIAEYPAAQEYGPLLILKHQPTPGIAFYTLYGHLDAEALEQLTVGRAVAAGERIATIGACPRNGNWAPHLHFQLISDLLDFGDTFPGVCLPQQRELWTALSPDPDVILRLPVPSQPPAGVARAALKKRRAAALNPALSLSYQQPLKIVRGRMQHLYDEDGQPYLDCVNNVAHVGHCHPRLLRAAQEQSALLNTNTRYLHDSIVEYAEALAATLPERLSVCFFVNSGSEANELALRLARAYSGGSDVIVIEHAYHGHTSALIDISPYKFAGRGGAGKAEHVQVAAMPDGYRGAVRGYGAEAGAFYARSVMEKIAAVQARGGRLAAFFAEGILGCGGQMPLPAGYLKRAYAAVRAAGGLCVADEVQTGFGRVGQRFWAFELGDVVPDIVTMGKPMGNGHPLGAVVTTPEIAAAFDNGMEYFNTFGGNPVSCAIGLELLRIIADEGLQRHAQAIGSYWLARLKALASDFPLIGQARGAGLFLGIDLARDAMTRAPAAWEAAYIAERMKTRGILVSTEGPGRNVLKLKPPLAIQRGDVDRFMAVLADVLGDTVLRRR